MRYVLGRTLTLGQIWPEADPLRRRNYLSTFATPISPFKVA